MILVQSCDQCHDLLNSPTMFRLLQQILIRAKHGVVERMNPRFAPIVGLWLLSILIPFINAAPSLSLMFVLRPKVLETG